MSVDEQRMSLNMQDNSLTISGTIVRDSGVYTCVITNGLDEARAYAFLTVKGNEIGACRKFPQNLLQSLKNEPHCEKTGFLHMRKQRRRSASR